MFAKLISMARTPDEAKKELAQYASVPSPEATVATYPYGLCISLDDDTLEKLGLDGDLPAVGEVLQFTAIAKVTSASVNEREKSDGTKDQCRRVELQITDMGIPAVDAADEQIERSAARRKRFYGDKSETADA